MSNVNVTSEIAKFYKPDFVKTMVIHQLLPAYSTKKGIELFVKYGVRSFRQELDLLCDKKVTQKKLPSELNGEQKRRYLDYIILLKHKTDISINVRGCAYGRPHIRWMKN